MSSVLQYKRTEVIGRGKFGVVYKAYHKQTKQIYAIKVLNLDTEEEEIKDVQQEIQFLSELKNVPNITHYYGSILHDTKLWIVMDYCAGGSLRTLLKPGVLEEKYIAVITRELLMTLSEVHKMGVIHRDLKAANVLITKEGNVQLCDFGVAAKISSKSQRRTTMAGTPYWMAPEVIKSGETYNSKADIWSLGVTIYETATGNPPYCDKDASWAMQLIAKATPPRLEGGDYSPALKECVALCLDENPEDRPSADDLLRCKLVKLYKNYPTGILKEVISRYLLWRERHSSRDSVFINLEHEHEDTVDEIVKNKLPGFGEDDVGNNNGNTTNANGDQIQVKWDFDSLESKEYMMENDIDINKVDYSKNYETQSGENTYSTLPTLKGSSTADRSNNTATFNQLQQGGTMKNASDVPRTLQMLFEDPDENKLEFSGYAAPPTIGNDGTESPTIEIPDMEALSSFPSTSNLTAHTNNNSNNNNNSTSNSNSNNLHNPQVLNRPPALYHTQSASGALESRFNPLNTSPVEPRPRKKTISNTLGHSGSNLSPTPSGPMPHTPPYTNNSNSIRTPSPKPPVSSGLQNLTNIVSKAGSPSKMKALQGNTNPLLQPINFNASTTDVSRAAGTSNAGAINIGGNSSTSLGVPGSTVGTPPQLVQQHSMPILPQQGAHSSGLHSANLKARRNRPGFIQMPTPSNTVNTLAALTTSSDLHRDDKDVNQFGISISQAAQMPISMTPVTEKEPIQFAGKPDAQIEKGVAKETSSITTSKPHQSSLLAQKKSQPPPQPQPQPHPQPQPQPQPQPSLSLSPSNQVFINASASQPNLTLGHTKSTVETTSEHNSSFSAPAFPQNSLNPPHLPHPHPHPHPHPPLASSFTAKSATIFPSVPAINGDFFLDSSTSKNNLVNELDSMIQLFTQGLDALEESL